MYSQHNISPQQPAGIMPQGQRPQGYGRAANLPPQGGVIPQQPLPGYPPQQGYQQGYSPNISFVSRLAAQIPMNQYLNGIPANEMTGEGFNAYSYQREKRQQQQQQQPVVQNSFFGDLSPHAQAQAGQQQIDQEQYLQSVKEYSARAANKIYEQLHNKIGAPSEAAKAALARFTQSENGVVDGVVNEYIDEIHGNIQLYRYCCSYTCIILTALFTEQVMQGRGDDVENNLQALCSMTTEAMTTVVALQFLDWLEKHPRSLLMVNRLLPKTLQNITNLENKMGGIESTVLSVGDMRQAIAFPWRKGTLQRIRQTAEAGAGTYDFYSMYNTGEPLENHWGGQNNVSQYHHTPSQDTTMPEWYKAYKKALFAEEEIQQQPSLYGRSNDVMMLNPVNNNWDESQRQVQRPMTPPPYQHQAQQQPQYQHQQQQRPVPQPDNQPLPLDMQSQEEPQTQESWVEVQLEKKAAELVRETVHQSNPMEWFVKLPDGTNSQYVVHPRYFKHIAKVLRYDGREIAYDRLGVNGDYLPIVDLGWENRVYNYELLYVGSANMKFFLTNPQHVLPQLKEVKEGREKYAKVYNDYIEDLNEALTPAEEEAEKECREMKKEPKVVHTNVPIVSDSNEGCVQAVRQVASLVGKKYKKRPDAIIIPTESLKPLEIMDAPDFHYDQIEEHLSYLVTGYKPKGDVGQYLMTIIKGIGQVGSPMLKFYVEEHLTDVFNRWLVERRFYSPTRDNGDYIKVGNIIEDYEELIEVLERYKDKESIEILKHLDDDAFFAENLTVFASKKRQAEYIESETKNIDNPVLREAKVLSLTASALTQREFVIAHIDPMTPLEGPGRVVMEGSQYPELQWLVQNAPQFAFRHFGGRNVPVVVMFNKDSYPRMWTSVFSPFCIHKFTLRQISLNKPLTMLKVV